MDAIKRRIYWRERKRRWRGLKARDPLPNGRPRLADSPARQAWREQKARRRALLSLL